MSDVNCPYCSKGLEICHDDGYGYEEGKTFEQECSSCEKTFEFSTTISLSYEVYCKEGDHDLEPSGYISKYGRGEKYECGKCDYIGYEKDQSNDKVKN